MFKKYVKDTHKKCLHTQKMFAHPKNVKKVAVFVARRTYLGFWFGGGTLQQRHQKIFWGWNETT